VNFLLKLNYFILLCFSSTLFQTTFTTFWKKRRRKINNKKKRMPRKVVADEDSVSEVGADNVCEVKLKNSDRKCGRNKDTCRHSKKAMEEKEKRRRSKLNPKKNRRGKKKASMVESLSSV